VGGWCCPGFLSEEKDDGQPDDGVILSSIGDWCRIKKRRKEQEEGNDEEYNACTKEAGKRCNDSGQDGQELL
jgi:hypothetical protein